MKAIRRAHLITWLLKVKTEQPELYKIIIQKLK